MLYSRGNFIELLIQFWLSYNTDLTGDQGVDYLKSSIQHMLNVGNIILDNRNSSTDPINLDKLTNKQSAELGKYLATADINEKQIHPQYEPTQTSNPNFLDANYYSFG